MKILVTLILITCTNLTLAEPLNSVESTKELCNAAASEFGKGDIEKAFKVLEPHWPLPKEEFQNLTYQTKSQLQMAESRFGKHIGHDFVSTSVAGSSFVRHTFVAKFERHAVRYICLFYKPQKAWVVNAVFWDDNTPLLFD